MDMVSFSNVGLFEMYNKSVSREFCNRALPNQVQVEIYNRNCSLPFLELFDPTVGKIYHRHFAGAILGT